MRYKIKKIGLFAIACGIVAFAYLLYRVVAVTFPVAVMGGHYMSSKPALPACLAEKEDQSNVDKAPILSPEYQKFIGSQKHESANLVHNPNLLIQEGSTVPDGYVPNTKDDAASYSSQQDSDGSKYLQITSNNYKKTDPEIYPGWSTNAISIEKGQTYAYEFDYRAEVPVQVQLELKSGNTVFYQRVTELTPSRQWKKFTGHYQSVNGVENIKVITSIKEPGSLNVKNYSVFNIKSSQLNQGGIITVTFDDGWRSFYAKAFPLFQKYQVPTTQFIVSDFSEKKIAGYMNVDEVAKLKRAGNEIGSHSLLHCDQAKMTQHEITDDTTQSKNILNGRSLGPIKSFAYPHGSYTADTQRAIVPEYELIRTSDSGYNDRYFDRTNIRSMSITSTTTDRELESWLQYASDNNVWLVLTYHRVDETGGYSNTSKQIEDHLKMIKESKLRAMTLSDAAKAVRSDR